MSYQRPPSQGRPTTMQNAAPMSRGGQSRAGPQAAGQGTSLMKPVEVAQQQSVLREGIKSSAGGKTSYGAREVKDRSYYAGLIRPRIMELTVEIERLRAEETRIAGNSGMLLQMQQKQKTYQDEIGSLKSTLSDTNFAVEQASASTDPDAIQAQAQKLRQDNAETRRNLDKQFLQTREAQTQQKALEKQLADEIHKLDDQLRAGADPALYQQYRNTRDEAYRVADQVAQMQQEIRGQETKMDSLNLTLGKDPDKRRAAAMVLEILTKRQSREEMQRETSITVEEEKTQLMAQARQTAQDIDILQRQIAEGRDAIQDSTARIAALDDDLQEYGGDNARKFQELQDKDREMQEFIESFPDREREETKRIADLEHVIRVLLEHISSKQLLKQQMPTDNGRVRMGEMGAEVEEREGQLKAAKATYARLQQQLVEKKEEFEKVKFLDQKISGELEAISHRMAEQQQDIVRFSDLDALRREIEARKAHLTKTKARVSTQRDAAKQQLHLLSKDYESAKAQLGENQVYTSMQTQEQRLRVVWQSSFALEDFVRSKEKESQFQATKADCIRMVDDIHIALRDPKRAEGATVTVLPM